MKVISIFCSTFLLFLNNYVFPQEWVRTYTSNEGDGYGARWVIESYDNGYLILADASNYKYGVILKTDINGNELWHKFFGNGQYSNYPANIQQTQDSGYIVSGTLGKYGTLDAYILKLNSCFEKEWCKVLYNNNYYPDYGGRVRQLPNGGYLLLTVLYEGILPGERIHLHRFNGEGEIIWQQNYAYSDSLLFNEEGSDLSIINQNEYLITGDGFYPDSGQYIGKRRPLLIKTDGSGAYLWETIWRFNDEYLGTSYNSSLDMSGNIYSIGFHTNENGQYPTMIKTGSNGEEIFYSHLVDTSHYGQGQTITFMEDSNLFIALGWKNTEDYWYNGFMKVDTQGNVLGYKDVQPISHALYSTAKTFDNKFITVGIHRDQELQKWVIYAFKINENLEYDTIYSAPFVYDSLCPYGITSDTTDLDCDILVMIENEFVPLKQAEMQIFPNPARDRVTIRFPDITH